MKRSFLVALAAVVGLFVLSGCFLLGGKQTAEVNVPVYLTDARVGNVDKLIVSIDGVAYHYELENEEGITVTLDVATEVDLLSLSGTETQLFEMENVPEDATLVWIGLAINKATVTVSGTDYPVEVFFTGKATEEVNKKNYLKILVGEKVSDGDDFLLDFDALQSLRKVDKNTYIMIPVIAHVHRNRYKKIHHKITARLVWEGSEKPAEGVVALLLNTDESTILRGSVSDTDGFLKICGVKDGSYRLAFYTDIEPGDIYDENGNLILTLEASVSATDVNLEAVDMDLGTIEIPQE